MSGKRVRVIVRTRPTANFAHDIIKLDEGNKIISIDMGKNADQMRGFINNQQHNWSFTMDGVLHNATQEEVYDSCAQSLIAQLMSGYSGTILAYGETGAGKTYTMCGPPNSYVARGIIPRAISQVFATVRENQEFTYTIRVNHMEIYNEVIYDLLSTLPDSSSTTSPPSHPYSSSPHPSPPHPLTISEDDRGGVYVKGLTTRVVQSEEEALNMLFEGETNRTIAEHSLNQHSSRSHCIFTITVEARSRTHSGAEYTVSRLNLVDLAGSERLSKTNSTGVTEKEAMHINCSLSFLEQVCIALADHTRDHVPYRQSKLTHILKDSLGGSSHTVLIANVWAEAAEIPETLSTLKFASRMKCIRTSPSRHIVQDQQLLTRQYEGEIRLLKQELAMQNTVLNRGQVSYEPLTEHDVEEIRQQMLAYLEGTLADIPLVSVRQVKEVFQQFKAVAQSPESSLPPGSQQTGSFPPSLPHHPSPHTDTSTKSKRDKVPSSSPSGTTHIAVESSDREPHKHSVSPVAALKKVKAQVKNEGGQKSSASKSITSTKQPEPVFHSFEEGQEEAPTSEASSHVARPSTPPSRREAFEQFKRGRGSEINKILVSNKKTLQQKKKEVIEISTSINALKKSMDQLRDILTEYCGDGQQPEMEEREVVMEERQFNALTKLKQLKASYRVQYGSLQQVEQEVEHCSLYVLQSREKLLHEFVEWYRLVFIGEGSEEDHKRQEEETTEYDEKSIAAPKMLTEDDPSSTAFYTAHLRTEKRSYTRDHAHPNRRRPGLITSSHI